MAKKYYTEDVVAEGTVPAIKYEDSAPSGYTLIVDAAQLLSLTKKTYRERCDAGREFTNDCLSLWRTQIEDATYTEAEVSDLERHISQVLTETEIGAWKTAKDVLTDLGLSGIFDATMKSDIGALLDTYIAANY